MSMENKKAPAFSLPDQDGVIRTLKDYAGKHVLLFFYPRDMTSGCTIEARGFQSYLPKFKKLGVEIIGISKLTSKSKKKFCDKEGLKYTLLSDEDLKIAIGYGVLKEKNMYGKKVKGIQRDSFLIGPDGKILKHYEKVVPAEHPDEVIKDVKALK